MNNFFHPEDSPAGPPPKNKVNSMKNAVIGIVFVFIILGIGGVTFLIGKSQNSENNNSGPTPTSILKTFGTQDEVTPTLIPTTIPTKTATLTPTKAATQSASLKSLNVLSNKTLDGFRSSNNGGNDKLDIRAGRNSSLTTRGLVSFDIKTLPVDADIESATIRLYQTKTIGKPYDLLGKLKIDYLDMGPGLDQADFGSPALVLNIATLSTEAKNGWKEADVTQAVVSVLQSKGQKTDFRIHFEKEELGSDIEGDFVYFESADNSEKSGNIPQLLIKYY